MVARFLGVRVWELSRVAAHYHEEARVILQAQYEAKVEKSNKMAKAGNPVSEPPIPEY